MRDKTRDKRRGEGRRMKGERSKCARAKKREVVHSNTGAMEENGSNSARYIYIARHV